MDDNGECLNEALTYALKIPENTKKDKKLCKEAIELIARTSSTRVRQQANVNTCTTNSILSDVHIRSTKALVERSPHNVSFYIELASAYCISGNNLDGAKWYRKALNINMPSEEREQITDDLITAQLQCPGMPLEHHQILAKNGNQLICMPPNQEASMQRTTSSGQAMGMIIPTSETGANIMYYTLPSDPNDPEKFPSSFLQKVIGNKRISKRPNNKRTSSTDRTEPERWHPM